MPFFDKLAEEKDLPMTSQPSPEEYLEFFEEAKSKGEEVLVLTLSSGLSGTINAANLAKQMSEYDKIWIIDSEQAIITQRFLVQKAVELREEEKKLQRICKNPGGSEKACDRMRNAGYSDLSEKGWKNSGGAGRSRKYASH